MADKEKNTKKAANEEFSFEMFIGDDGAQILDNEKLASINKQLPDWSIEPPAKQ